MMWKMSFLKRYLLYTVKELVTMVIAFQFIFNCTSVFEAEGSLNCYYHVIFDWKITEKLSEK